MKLWSAVIIGVLTVVLISLCVVTFTLQRTNSAANQSNVIFPFSSAISPGQSISSLKNAAGLPQIDCSAVGGKVNILGAFVEVIDPFGSCSGSPSTALNTTCGLISPKDSIPCSQDADCGTGMNCAGSVCRPSACPITSGDDFDNSKCNCGGTYCPVRPGKACTTNKDCKDDNGTLMSCSGSTGSKMCKVNPGQACMAPDPFSGSSCALYPLCSNLTGTDKNVINKVCTSANSTSNCRPRDASSYLAAKCNGQTTCNITFDPVNPNSGFGPSPCSAAIKPGTEGYTSLPITPGQGGSYTQGYYVHGIYSCIIPS